MIYSAKRDRQKCGLETTQGHRVGSAELGGGDRVECWLENSRQREISELEILFLGDGVIPMKTSFKMNSQNWGVR